MSAEGNPKPIEISVQDIANKDFEDIRMDIWSSYNSNAQNHASSILSIIIALLALSSGFVALPTNIIGALLLFLTAVGLLFLFAWLSLRNLYWGIWCDRVSMLTYADFVELFNTHNRNHSYYVNNKPPNSAIIILSVQEYLIRRKEKPTNLSLIRKLALKTSV